MPIPAKKDIMWRHLRGLQHRFNRSLCSDKLETSSKDGQVKVHQTNNGSLTKNFLCPIASNLNWSVLKCPNNNKKKKKCNEETSGNISQHSFLEAFGWSGALVFCWAVSKHLWLSHTWNRDEDRKQFCYNQNIVNLLSRIVKTQPPVNYVLPQLKSVSSDDLITDKSRTKPNGPSKENDEFDEAVKELQELHQRTVGESLNRRGISCLSKSTGSEAMAYFIRASELKYPPASFNIGQCYELGIGTEQDFKQAAEWYKTASEQGHPTAMYNLGVFYAHGWGGLPANIDCAKKLFVKAAQLGQPDAQAALDQESKFQSYNLLISISKSTSNNNESNSTNTEPSDLNLFVNSLQNGLSDDVFQRSFGPDATWNISLNSTLAF